VGSSHPEITPPTNLHQLRDTTNLSGLANFLDIYRTLSRVLLAWHKRRMHNEIVISAAYVTTGLQEVLATLIGARGEMQAEVPGFGKAILANLRADEDLVRAELDRHRVPAIVSATVDEMIRVRAISLQRPIYDEWSKGRRDWVSRWIDEMQLARPSEADLQEIGTEFRVAAQASLAPLVGHKDSLGHFPGWTATSPLRVLYTQAPVEIGHKRFGCRFAEKPQKSVTF
jgi:hypothetical protein